jgi:hypothetical protein
MTVESTENLQRRVHTQLVLVLSGLTIPGSDVIYSEFPSGVFGLLPHAV